MAIKAGGNGQELLEEVEWGVRAAGEKKAMGFYEWWLGIIKGGELGKLFKTKLLMIFQ